MPTLRASRRGNGKLKQINKLTEVLDFLSYKNAYKNDGFRGQTKVVMVNIGAQSVFYIFYVTTDDSNTGFTKYAWEGYFTNTADNVQAGINQSSVGYDGIPVTNFEVSGADTGFYYFYNTFKSKGIAKWGWARAETPAGALKYLNTKYSNQPIPDPRIAAVQEPGQTVFYE